MRNLPGNLVGIVACALIAGCTRDASNIESELDAKEIDGVVQIHDLGLVLSRGQIIEHRFELANLSNRPFTILGAQAMQPCCSEVVRYPRSIPPRSKGDLTVRFRPGYQSGHKQVEFHVGTDRDEAPVLTRILRAELVSEIQVDPRQGENLSLLMGGSGNQVLRVVGRRLPQGEGLSGPETISGTGMIEPRFEGEATERLLPNGVVETARDVVVTIPPRSDLGSQSETLIVGWPGRRQWEHRVRWQVSPHLQAIPDGLVIRPEESAKTVMVRSRNSPFRILSVDDEAGARGPSISWNPSTAREHVLRLGFDGVRPAASGPFDLKIRTDHPEQPEVVISVLFARSGTEVTP